MKSKGVGIAIGAEMVLVIIVFFFKPFMSNPNIMAWINTDSMWLFIINILVSVLLMAILACRNTGTPKVQNTEKTQERKTANLVAPCYCCEENRPVPEMKILLICKKCQKEQNIL